MVMLSLQHLSPAYGPVQHLPPAAARCARTRARPNGGSARLPIVPAALPRTTRSAVERPARPLRLLIIALSGGLAWAVTLLVALGVHSWALPLILALVAG